MKWYKTGKKNKESGMILMASTMGIFIILSIFAFYLARFSITETRSGAYYIQDIRTRNLALTGAEHGLQIFRESRITSNLTGNLNKGNYIVSFDSNNDETNSALPYSHFLMIKSSASIDDVRRNIRYIISSIPEAFCFSFYGNNASDQMLNWSGGTISGDMFFNGSVGPGSGTSSGTTYISSGTGGMQIPSYPSFPYIDSSHYENLLTSASKLKVHTLIMHLILMVPINMSKSQTQTTLIQAVIITLRKQLRPGLTLKTKISLQENKPSMSRVELLGA